MRKDKSTDNYLHLGDLELRIMDIIWDKDTYCTVSEIHEVLYPENKLAYTTIMTVMGNLYKKGVLKRKKESKAYLYAPNVQREEIAQGEINKVTQTFYKDNIPEFFRCFLKSYKTISKDQINELKRKLEELEEGTEKE
jgi:predicted transcriptional regulator